MSTTGAYQLGLCLAGAATGGAYSAGVMDFLIEALQCWEAEKMSGRPDVPRWDVQLDELIGTSAGGITATLAAASLNTRYEPMPRSFKVGGHIPPTNTLYQLWVKEMNAEQLLQTGDFETENRRGDDSTKNYVKSLLYSNYMQEVSARVLDADLIEGELPRWADNASLTLTATNLRGVPYSIKSFTSQNGSYSYTMRQFADYTRFQLTADGNEHGESEPTKDSYVLDVTKKRNTKEWIRAVDCTRATAAFPLGFPVVRLETPKHHYNKRQDDFPGWNLVKDDPVAQDGYYTYSAVDGGVVNNEPFGLAQKFMEENGQKKLESSAPDAWASIVLIDPFHGDSGDSVVVEDQLPIRDLISPLISALRGQASFKQDEITRHASGEGLEKFIIHPVRPDANPQEGIPLIASAVLGGFGGIIDEQLRHHDFMLGRHNCQQFLQNVFVISKADAKRNQILRQGGSDQLDADHVPIIPLVGKAAEPIGLPQWPKYSQRESDAIVDNVSSLVDKRIGLILNTMFTNLGLKTDVSFLRPRKWVFNYGVNTVIDRLQERATSEVRDMLEKTMTLFT